MYSVEGSTFKKNELQWKQGKYVTKKDQGFILNNLIKKI